MGEWTRVHKEQIHRRVFRTTQTVVQEYGVFLISEGPGKTGQKRVPKHLFVARLGMQIESPGEVGPRYNM